MERTSLSKGHKDHCIGSNGTSKGDSKTIVERRSIYHNILKPRSIGADHQDSRFVGPGGLVSWPSRSYPCGFCKREFRSAQALGGHMNVHRRDRARLRLSSPPSSSDDFPVLSLNPNANSNPNPSPNPIPPPVFPSSTSSVVSRHLHSLALPSHMANVKMAGLKSTSSSILKDGPSSAEVFRLQPPTLRHRRQGEGSSKSFRNNNLSLEIGNLFGQPLKAADIDLELRLGYS